MYIKNHLLILLFTTTSYTNTYIYIYLKCTPFVWKITGIVFQYMDLIIIIIIINPFLIIFRTDGVYLIEIQNCNKKKKHTK